MVADNILWPLIRSENKILSTTNRAQETSACWSIMLHQLDALFTELMPPLDNILAPVIERADTFPIRLKLITNLVLLSLARQCLY